MTTLQTHYVYFTLKERENDRFHIVSTENTRVFVGNECYNKWQLLKTSGLTNANETKGQSDS